MRKDAVLVDSSVVIDCLRQKEKQKTWFFRVLSAGYFVKISIVTHTELYSGKSIWEKPEAKKVLENLLKGVEVISLLEETSKLAGKLRATLRLGAMDAIIAATANKYQLPLVTLNEKDFKKVKELKLLRLKDLKA